VNVPAPAGPAVNPIPSVNTGYAPLEAVSGAAGDALPHGGFQEVLEQRLRSAAGADGDPAASARAGETTLSDAATSTQRPDSSTISGDAMAALLGFTALPALPAGQAAAAIGADAAQAVAAARQQAIGRSPAAGAAPLPADVLRSEGGDDGADMSGRAALAADPRAAMDAVAGRRLPQAAADSPPGFRTLPAEAVTPRIGPEAARMMQPAGPAAPDAGGIMPPVSHAPAVPSPADTRAATTQVATPFGRPEWSSAMNERVTWLVGQRVQSADIQLNPPQLGPVEVRITIQNDQASVFFSSQHAAVREAILAALPRLNDMLAQGGLSLGQTSVGADAFAGQQQASRDGGGRRPDTDASGGSAGPGISAPPPGLPITARGGLGIDMFV